VGRPMPDGRRRQRRSSGGNQMAGVGVLRSPRRLCSALIVLVFAYCGLAAASATAHADADVMPRRDVVSQVSACPGTPTVDYSAQTDPYSLYNQVRDIGATDFYQAGYFGDGVDVAVIDSGVARVPGFDPAHVVDGPDLSFESQAPYGAPPNA